MTHDEYRTKYTSTLEYPTKNGYTKAFVYSGGKVLFEGDLNALNEAMSKSKFPKGAIFEKVVDVDAFRAACCDYDADQARLTEQFKQDLFVEHDVTTNPKRDKCFSLAWDQGHSDGYGEIALCFDTFVDLIKD